MERDYPLGETWLMEISSNDCPLTEPRREFDKGSIFWLVKREIKLEMLYFVIFAEI